MEEGWEITTLPQLWLEDHPVFLSLQFLNEAPKSQHRCSARGGNGLCCPVFLPALFLAEQPLSLPCLIFSNPAWGRWWGHRRRILQGVLFGLEMFKCLLHFLQEGKSQGLWESTALWPQTAGTPVPLARPWDWSQATPTLGTMRNSRPTQTWPTTHLQSSDSGCYSF